MTLMANWYQIAAFVVRAWRKVPFGNQMMPLGFSGYAVAAEEAAATETMRLTTNSFFWRMTPLWSR